MGAININSTSWDTLNSTSTDTVTVAGLDKIKADLTLEVPDPITTDSTIDVKPLKTDSSILVDLKPAVIDLCLTANIGKVPSVCIRQPYRHHLAFTLYGTEVWGFTFSGEQETVVDELERRPQVSLGGAQASWPPPKAASQPAAQPQTRTAGGLRVRLGS